MQTSEHKNRRFDGHTNSRVDFLCHWKKERVSEGNKTKLPLTKESKVSQVLHCLCLPSEEPDLRAVISER